ncbi:MAG: hypothetical protein QCI38_03470, partial [Candidatus Thermoplasmatota archaeon]|nr:hypothetical protein [Candidatus Thermoplasmatota archaeon]
DAAGNYHNVSVTYIVDNTPPVVTITAPVDGGQYQTADVPAGAYNVVEANTIASEVEGGWSDVEGTHTYWVNVTDAAGNYHNVSVTYIVDNTPPVTEVDVIDPYWHSFPVDIPVTANDNLTGVASVELFYRYSQDGTNWTNWTSWDVIFAPDPFVFVFTFPHDSGMYEFYSIGIDGVGNVEVKDPAAPEAECGLVHVEFFEIDADEGQVAGVEFQIQVTAYAEDSVIATDYVGWVEFSCDDEFETFPGILPAPYLFVVDDNGTVTLNMTLFTAGQWTLTVMDWFNNSIMGNFTFTVAPGPVFALDLDVPADVNAGAEFEGTVTAVDQWGNVITDYEGTIRFSVTPAAASDVLPEDYTFNATSDGGVANFAFKLFVAGPRDIFVWQNGTASINATATVNVLPGPVRYIYIEDDAVDLEPWTVFNVWVNFTDRFGNYIEAPVLIHFSSSDPGAQVNWTAMGTWFWYGPGTPLEAVFAEGGQHWLRVDVMAGYFAVAHYDVHYYRGDIILLEGWDDDSMWGVVGDNIYVPDFDVIDNQTVMLPISPNGTAVFPVILENDGAFADDLTLTWLNWTLPEGWSYQVLYYWLEDAANDTWASTDVTALGSHTVNVEAGEMTFYEVILHANNTAVAGDMGWMNLTVEDAWSPDRQANDTGRIVAFVPEADVMVIVLQDENDDYFFPGADIVWPHTLPAGYKFDLYAMLGNMTYEFLIEPPVEAWWNITNTDGANASFAEGVNPFSANVTLMLGDAAGNVSITASYWNVDAGEWWNFTWNLTVSLAWNAVNLTDVPAGDEYLGNETAPQDIEVATILNIFASMYSEEGLYQGLAPMAEFEVEGADAMIIGGGGGMIQVNFGNEPGLVWVHVTVDFFGDIFTDSIVFNVLPPAADGAQVVDNAWNPAVDEDAWVGQHFEFFGQVWNNTIGDIDFDLDGLTWTITEGGGFNGVVTVDETMVHVYTGTSLVDGWVVINMTYVDPVSNTTFWYEFNITVLGAEVDWISIALDPMGENVMPPVSQQVYGVTLEGYAAMYNNTAGFLGLIEDPVWWVENDATANSTGWENWFNGTTIDEPGTSWWNMSWEVTPGIWWNISVEIQFQEYDSVKICYADGTPIANEFNQIAGTYAADMDLYAWAFDGIIAVAPISGAWSIANTMSGNGAIDPEEGYSTTFTIGNRAGTRTVTLIYGNFTDTFVFQVIPEEMISQLRIVPGAATYTADQATVFEAHGYDQYGNFIEVVWGGAWSIDVNATFPRNNTLSVVRTIVGPMITDEVVTVTWNRAGTDTVSVFVADLDLTATLAITVLPGEVATIVIHPAAPADINADDQLAFTIDAYDADGNWITNDTSMFGWETNDLEATLVDGLFTAHTAGTWTIWANITTVVNGNVSQSVTLTVAPGALFELVIDPDPLPTTLSADDPLVITITALDQHGNEIPYVDGLFTVEATNGTVVIGGTRASTVTFTPWNSGDVTIWINGTGITPITSTVSVAPGLATNLHIDNLPPATMTADDVWRFNVTILDAKGNVVPGTFSVEYTNGTATIVGTEAWVEGWNLGVHTFWVNGSGVSRMFNIEITPGELASIVLTAAGDVTQLNLSATLQFTAAGFDAKGNPVTVTWTWSASNGTISNAGVYTPGAAGTFTITVEANGVTQTYTITVVDDTTPDDGDTDGDVAGDFFSDYWWLFLLLIIIVVVIL